MTTRESSTISREKREQPCADRELVINRADKSSCLVVKNRQDYIREGLEHLLDTNTYVKLDKDCTQAVADHITGTPETYRRGGLLSLQMVNKCKPLANPRTARLYFLTKTHKNPTSIRPIVSCSKCATENLSRQTPATNLPAYIKDTTQFINEIAEVKIQPTDLLVTVDVRFLYTCIPNQAGIDANHSAWQQTDPQHPPAEVLLSSTGTSTQTQHPRIQPRALLTNSRYCHGPKISSSLCKHIHGTIGKINTRNQPIQA